MYKVFVNERQLVLTNKLFETDNKEYYPLNDKAIKQVVKALAKGKLERAYIYHPNHEEILKNFTKTIPLVVAAGGVVTNETGKVLFIYRNDKWDLPKGRLDKGESIKDCAIREVMEETGIEDVKIDNFLRTTYHIFKNNGTYKLKEVHWFAMRSNFQGELVGEAKEGIIKVRWKGPQKIREALENSYANIKILFAD